MNKPQAVLYSCKQKFTLGHPCRCGASLAQHFVRLVNCHSSICSGGIIPRRFHYITVHRQPASTEYHNAFVFLGAIHGSIVSRVSLLGWPHAAPPKPGTIILMESSTSQTDHLRQSVLLWKLILAHCSFFWKRSSCPCKFSVCCLSCAPLFAQHAQGI